MKNLKVLCNITIYMIVIMFISSCSMMKQDDFSKQKYTKFRKGEASVNINRVSKEKKNDEQLCMVPVIKAETVIIPADKPIENIATVTPETKHNTGKTLKKLNFIQRQIKKAVLKRAEAIVMKQHLRNTSTVSYVDNSRLLLLAIVAIFIPPLAVYLVRGIGNAFWIDILLWLCFILPGIIFALIVVFDVR